VRTVAAGDAWLDPSVTGRVLAAFRDAIGTTNRRAPAADPSLTARELDVLKLVARGSSNAEIADQLVISEVTVKTHLGNILGKLGLRDRAAAIVYAFDAGLAAPAFDQSGYR
jgi:DNA-binding NarL/FixJ family response regulator